MNSEHGKLLVVDDNEMNRDMLSRRLGRKGHSVVTAEDGRAALERIQQEPFELVLLDIEMPGMDGFEVLRTIRETFDASDLPVVMATARTESDDIVRALKSGANDYVTKPLDFPVVLARVQTQLALKRSKDELSAAYTRMKRDLDAAARVQQALLPSEPPVASRYRFAWQYRPCDELAGDSLNVFNIDDRYMGLYVLDVSGHGVPAALLSVTATHRLAHLEGRASLVTDPVNEPPGYVIVSPAEVARRLNALYQMAANGNHYFTMIYGVLDTHAHQLRFAAAGHPGPVLVRRDQPARILDTPSVPIGVIKESEYEDAVLDLEPGDRLYLYSDGVNEERNSQNKQFGRSKLCSTLVGSKSLSLANSIDALVQELIAWRGDDHFSDDVSILGFELCDA